ncbi:MAG: GLPGLI family protein [Chitinophagaceae bacterium]|jgi:GLPGLI family protein|nr:GLPGLI family protein [Chitinophagaceae bacterium]
MKKQLLSGIFFSIILQAGAQTNFFSSVNIEFEKTTYVHQYYKELEPEWFEQIKERLPQTFLNYYIYTGSQEKSIYRPGKETPVDSRTWYRPVADKNVVFTDFVKSTTISQKPVYEETFLIEDSLLPIKWKITADTRMIAGYNCRKAIGILYDSIALFAFYTDEILISGGPEGIQGLPGMILGLGVPRLHATWFATKVEVYDVNLKAITPAIKGKKVTRENMIQSIDKVLKTWGNYGSKMIINYLI